MVQQIFFTIITVLAFWYAIKQFISIKDKIFLGKDYKFEGNKTVAFKNMFLIALGQKKMFKRIVPGIFHLFIYVAFIFTQIELLEIFIDGFFGTHRFLSPFLGGLYGFVINIIEILSLLALIATFIFLSRRNLLKLPRFHMDEMTGWPKLDGNLILFLEILLIIGITLMNGADFVLQNRGLEHYHHAPGFIISQYTGPALFSTLSDSTLIIFERIGWWLHILVVYSFLNYLPISKHLHLVLAFFNTYFNPQKPVGKMDNMPEIMNEVKSMMGLVEDSGEMDMDAEIPEFGAKDVMGLTWKNVLDAYTCTECGRCSSVCPANETGKKLSPRKIMMDVRDRADEIYGKLKDGNEEFISDSLKKEGTKLSKDNFDDGKSLFDLISKEEIHACTTCNACVEACPVLISPVDIILQLRRYEILTLSEGPSDWMPMFTSMENGGCVWQMAESRDAWANE